MVKTVHPGTCQAQNEQDPLAIAALKRWAGAERRRRQEWMVIDGMEERQEKKRQVKKRQEKEKQEKVRQK